MCDTGEVEGVVRPEVKALVQSLEHLVPVSNTPVPYLEGVYKETGYKKCLENEGQGTPTYHDF